MLQCWNSNPNQRPDFSEIADIIGNLLDDKTKKVLICSRLIISIILILLYFYPFSIILS